MARFNQNIRRDPSRRMQPQRRASLEAKGLNIDWIMANKGIGERRAMALAEKGLGLAWHNGAFGKDAGHYPAQSA